MERAADWSAAVRDVASRTADALAQLLPSLLGAAAILLVGWVVARVLRAVTVRVTNLVDRQVGRLLARRGVEGPKVPAASAGLLGSLVFWLVLLLSAAAAAQVLGLTVILGWLDRLVGFAPTLLAGGFIVLAGHLLGRLAGELVRSTAAAGTPPQRAILGRAAQVAILATATVIGAEQIGVRLGLLVSVTTVAVASVLGGVALAVSLGARTHVANLIGARHLRERYQVGQVVRIGGHEGRILELTPVGVVLEVADGRATIPGRTFDEEPSLLVMPGPGDGGE